MLLLGLLGLGLPRCNGGRLFRSNGLSHYIMLTVLCVMKAP